MEKPAQYDIAVRAYDLWERDGRPHGRDQEYWFLAERELIGAATAAEDRPIGEVRQAEQASRAQQGPEGPPASPATPASPISPATTAAEDRPIGEIRQAQQASAKRAESKTSEKPEKSGEPGLSLLAPKKADDSADLTDQLNELQRLMAKKPATRAQSTRTRAKKTPSDAKAAAGTPPDNKSS